MRYFAGIGESLMLGDLGVRGRMRRSVLRCFLRLRMRARFVGMMGARLVRFPGFGLVRLMMWHVNVSLREQAK